MDELRLHTRLGALMLAPLFLAPLAAHAAEEEGHEHHAAHEHGRVTFNVALEGERLAIELEAPAANVVGFERAPRSEAERTALREAAAWLRSGRGAFGVPRAAECRLQRVELTVPAAHRDTTAPAAAGAEDPSGEHADYRSRFEYRCRAPEALAWLEFWIVRRLRDLESAEVNILTPLVQTSARLRSGGDIRVALR